jgi:hypothetical protein
MLMHLGASWVQKVSKMRLSAVQILRRIVWAFLEFIFPFLELFLFIRRLWIFFMSSKYFIWIPRDRKYLWAIVLRAPFRHGRNNLSFLFELSSSLPYAWTPLCSIYTWKLKIMCRCSLWLCPVVYCNYCTYKPQVSVQRKQHHACMYEQASKPAHLFFLF